ncbi:MAG: DUF5668 domain-containing protein [Vicinamibacteria bacterium]|jgi:TM2 domain-containing membrane protein YozV|nr:DUF5668 domain-containing protein [Vicinamibacteria bacterium]
MSTPLNPGFDSQPPIPQSYRRPPKSSALAALLSLVLPGIGQIYNAQVAKAFVFFFGFVTCMMAAIEASPMPFAMLLAFVYFYCVIDAYRSATAINNQALARIDVPKEETVEAPAWGIGLIVLGVVLLANSLDLIRFATYQRFWPLILIVAGVIFLMNALKKRQGTEG